MKSKEGKERWRNFMMAYDKRVDDYSFGTILRVSPKEEYGEKTTIFGASPFPSLPSWPSSKPSRGTLLGACPHGPTEKSLADMSRYSATDAVLRRRDS